jgi:hypothetical protein
MEHFRFCLVVAQMQMIFGAGEDIGRRRCGKRVGTGATGEPESPIRGAGSLVKNTPAQTSFYTCTTRTSHLLQCWNELKMM